MDTEFEVKILDIDVEEIKKKLDSIGAKKYLDRSMRRYVYDITPGDNSKWLRLRDDGENTTLTIKEIHNDNIDGTKEDIQEKRSELNFLVKKEARLRELESDYEEYKEKIDILNGLFPEEKEVSNYLTQLEQASINNNVHIDSIKIESSTKKNVQTETIDPKKTQLIKEGDFYKLPIEMSISSNQGFINVLSFIETMENLSRYTIISTFKITTSDEGILEASIKFNTYIK